MQKTSVGKKISGRNAASLKYDVLTALGAYGCAGDKHLQRLTLRLITLIVARYNWNSDEISVGQREIAALWYIDERSVKREMARLRVMGWIVVKRPAARGRVALHGLGVETILSRTEPVWPLVGSDFVARMKPGEPEPAKPASNVIAFPSPQGDGSLWHRIEGLLHREDPHLYAAWFAPLRAEMREEGKELHLIAPSRFHSDYLGRNFLDRLQTMARAMEPGLERVVLG